MIARIGGDEGILSQDVLHRFDHRDEQFLLAAGAVGLCFDDDLMPGINGCYAGIALNHAFGCCHLGGFVVGAVALAERAFAAFAVVRVGSQPLTDLGGITVQAGDALSFFLLEVGLDGALVFLAMPFEHDFGGGFQFAGLVFEVGSCAAFGFGGVAGQLDAVDGEHLSSDQALSVADEEYLGEDAGDVVTQGSDQSGDGGEVRLAVARQGNEGDVFAAGARYVATADDALG